jgi:hypothetical protein
MASLDAEPRQHDVLHCQRGALWHSAATVDAAKHRAGQTRGGPKTSRVHVSRMFAY